MICRSVQSITDTTGKASEHWNLWCGHGCWWRGGDPATAAERTGRPWTDLCCPPGQCQHGVVPAVCVVHLHWAVLPIICIAECPCLPVCTHACTRTSGASDGNLLQTKTRNCYILRLSCLLVYGRTDTLLLSLLNPMPRCRFAAEMLPNPGTLRCWEVVGTGLSGLREWGWQLYPERVCGGLTIGSKRDVHTLQGGRTMSHTELLTGTLGSTRRRC